MRPLRTIPVYIRSIWGYWRGTLPIVSCANTEALKRAGITRDTVSPIESVQIEKDANGDPTGIFVEHEMSPIAELIWFRNVAGFTHADRVKTLPQAARAYHGFGTTSVFEGHGVATEILRVYKEAYRNGALTMRATLALSPNWRAADGAAGRPVARGVGGMARRTRARRRLAQDERHLHRCRLRRLPTWCANALRPTPAGAATALDMA